MSLWNFVISRKLKNSLKNGEGMILTVAQQRCPPIPVEIYCQTC
jgi:hypothetical protein